MEEEEGLRLKPIILSGIKEAIQISKECVSEKGKLTPKVGTVIIKDGQIIQKAYRGELKEGEHAEYTALVRKKGNLDYSDAILITTLEPCTRRGRNKYPCAFHIVDSGIKEVWIGMLDPNPEISRKGSLYLEDKGIIVEYFPAKYREQVRQLNEEFEKFHLKKYKIDLMNSEIPSQTTEKKYLDDKIKDFYKKNEKELEKFLYGVSDALKTMEQLKEISFEYIFGKFEEFITGLEKCAKYGDILFYPEDAFSNFKTIKQLSMRIAGNYDSLSRLITDFKRKLINSPKIDINNWMSWFGDILIIQVRERLGFLPKLNNFGELLNRDKTYSRVFGVFRNEIRDFLYKISRPDFNKDFISNLNEIYSGLNQMLIGYKGYLKIHYLISLTGSGKEKKYQSF